MTTTSENNKRIAKNTLLLYFRMMLTMIVSLYTSRVVLSALGVEDFGIYNVVGGVVAMFAVLSGSLSSAISRFITYELGKGNIEKLKTIFSSAVTIQIALGLIIALIAETMGLWFLNVKMNIPENRMIAANWVFQFSIITFIINIISVPYNAAIIAHEKMSAFAYISILEVTGKLLIAYLIVISPIDKLIFYAILMCAIAMIIRFVYGIYCKKHFEECTYKFIFDKNLLKEMFGFAGWNFIGSSAVIFRDHGVNIILNIFYGPTINAARGIAIQVNGAITSFATNFMTAINPQITKSYANNDLQRTNDLINMGSKYSFYILLFLVLPIIIDTPTILKLWLQDIPNHTIIFVRLSLILALSESISGPLVTALLATGKIKKYQIIVGGLNFMNFPIAYILLKLGNFTNHPEIVYILAIIISQLCLVCRLFLFSNTIHLSPKNFIKYTYLNIIKVTIVSTLIPLIYKYYQDDIYSNFLISYLLSIISVSFSIIVFGLNSIEKGFIKTKFNILIKKI